MIKIILIIFYVIFYTQSLISQYVGIVCLGESTYIQKIELDNNGNITIGSLYTAIAWPIRLEITNNGLVLVANYSYGPTGPLSVFKIFNNGDIIKVRDYSLDGFGHEAKITKDNKYCLIIHSVENNPLHVAGITILELMNDDINPYIRQFYPYGQGYELATSGTGLVFDMGTRYIKILQMDSDGVLTDTGQLLDTGDTGNQELEVSPDNKYVYVAKIGGLLIYEIDENNNVTYKGRAQSSYYPDPTDIIVSKDSKTVLLLNLGSLEVYNVQENGDLIFNGQKFLLPLAQSATITPDGKFVVVAYDYRLEQEGLLSTLAVFRMNFDGTVTNLNKDVTLDNLPGEMKFYQLPTPSVDIDWKLYE